MLPATIIKRYRVSQGRTFRLADFDPADTSGLDIDKDEADALLAAATGRLSELQERLYAEHRWAILVILQGTDAAGKDSVIKHVLSGVNPEGFEVHSFKEPTRLELEHDFMWRTTVALPRRGHIGVFNRSYYEEVLVVRVHPELLAPQRLPAKLVTRNIWNERFDDIRAFERALGRNGILPIKFFLHVSKEEQRKRLLQRIEDPAKQWKFMNGDVGERRLWGRYMRAYQDMIRQTGTPGAPWYVVPADQKWFTRLVVAGAIVDLLAKIDPRFPKPDPPAMRELAKARAALLAEGSKRRKRSD